MFVYTVNNDHFGRRRSSVGMSAELVIIGLLVRCLYWALTLITNRHFVSCGRLVQVSVSQRHKPEKNEITKQKTRGHGTARISESGS